MDKPEPWFADNQPTKADARQHAPATLRNRDAILNVLREELPEGALVLEIASGSGEHARYFAERLPHIGWQPSDSSKAALASIAAWRSEGDTPGNLALPIRLDVMNASQWPDAAYDVLFAANLTHIAPFGVTRTLFEGALQLLPPQGKMLLYGPFFRDDAPPSDGDIAFDCSLRARDPDLGLRHVAHIDEAAGSSGFVRTATHIMPANNLTLVYCRS